MSSEFRLYPEERHWWSFNDYRAVLETMRERQPKRVLEFGPGSSTLALIEGGAARIDTCEDAADWAEVYEDRLQRKFPDVVRVHRYVWADPLSIPAIDGDRYDLALIDGPRGANLRHAVVRYCLDRCTAVLVPTEDSIDRAFRPFLLRLAAERGVAIAIRETGPHSVGFALFTPRTAAPDLPEVPSVLPEAITTPELPPLTRRERRQRGKGKRGGDGVSGERGRPGASSEPDEPGSGSAGPGGD
jgi:hypothetical protein